MDFYSVDLSPSELALSEAYGSLNKYFMKSLWENELEIPFRAARRGRDREAEPYRRESCASV